MMNVCSSPPPPPLFSGNPQRPYRGNMLQGDHRTGSQYAEHRPGPATLGRRGPLAIFRLTLFTHGQIPRPGGRSWPSEGQTAAAGETDSFRQQPSSSHRELRGPSE